MHRRTDIYGEDANEFKPERWDTIRPGWAYLPFNGGPRICLCKQFAMNEASYLTVRLCQEFEGLEGLGEEEWMEDLTLTCGSKNGTWVSLRPTQGTRVEAEDDGALRLQNRSNAVDAGSWNTVEKSGLATVCVY
jgi:Cytochrome P450